MRAGKPEPRSGLARAAALQRRIRAGREPRLLPVALLARLLSIPYGLGARLKNVLFDLGVRRAAKVEVPVVSVGNLTTGGTGKTPLVELLARSAVQAGMRPAILTRGYRRSGEAEGDEVRLYRRLLPSVDVVVDPDRVRGARAAREKGAGLLILDDGFQHRRLARGLDLVLADARDPFSSGRLLPFGMLREPARGLARAGALILTRCGRATQGEIDSACEEARALAPGITILLEDHLPDRLVDLEGASGPDLEELMGLPVLVFSGIADPTTLAETVGGLAADVLAVSDFGDHHPFSPADLEELQRDAVRVGAKMVVTTEKDLMRISGWQGEVPLYALRIRAGWVKDQDAKLLSALVGFDV
ncbi:MAG: tetraacyldisaccharide 4'-kinase [Planctomycetota bacterium]